MNSIERNEARRETFNSKISTLEDLITDRRLSSKTMNNLFDLSECVLEQNKK